MNNDMQLIQSQLNSIESEVKDARKLCHENDKKIDILSHDYESIKGTVMQTQVDMQEIKTHLLERRGVKSERLRLIDNWKFWLLLLATGFGGGLLEFIHKVMK